MAFLTAPLRFTDSSSEGLKLLRPLDTVESMLDNLIELIVFTPRGSFTSDPSFGFEYWNYEYVNIMFRDFNNGQIATYFGVTKHVCEESIKQSLVAYKPILGHIDVSVELNAIPMERHKNKRTLSKYEVSVRVSGTLDDGLSTERSYSKTVRFLMEPTAKKMTV